MKITELLSKPQLDSVERFADSLWKKLGVDVRFSRHFIERVNDSRNGKEINAAELIRLFKKEYQNYGKDIAGLPDNLEAVLKDLLTKLNMPFVIRDDGDEKNLIAKTVMRKDDFKTKDKEFVIKN